MAGQVELLIIGDELLLGKRTDRHLPRLIELLGERGMELAGAEFLRDEERVIADAIKRFREAGLPLLSCGGIGATPDDLTRQAAARAFGVAIERHPEAAALIEGHYGKRAWPNRILMADFPAGAALIPNPVNHVAGFSMGHCYFVPGFPEMAWPMLEWVLDGPLAHLHNADPPAEYRLRVSHIPGEGDLLPAMEETRAAHPGVWLSSLPTRGTPGQEGFIEIGLRGPRKDAEAAYRQFRAAVCDYPGACIDDVEVPRG